MSKRLIINGTGESERVLRSTAPTSDHVPTHPPATMQKLERKGVAGGASWKLLKTKLQICTGCSLLEAPTKCRGNAEIKEVGRLASISGQARAAWCRCQETDVLHS